MKSAIVLCALALVCSFSTGEAVNNALIAAITRLKSTTQTTTNQLTRYSSTLTYDLKSKLSNLKLDQMANINGVVNPALAAVRSAIDTAKANGKDAEHCYEPARLRLRAASQDGWKRLDECAETGLASISGVKSNIDSTILLGGRIINELDTIVISCYNNNINAMDNCIAQKIPGSSAAVKAYQNTAAELKRTGDSASSSAVTTAFSCNLNAIQPVRDEAISVRVDGVKCADNS